jgi:hypothetical protein
MVVQAGLVAASAADPPGSFQIVNDSGPVVTIVSIVPILAIAKTGTDLRIML